MSRVEKRKNQGKRAKHEKVDSKVNKKKKNEVSDKRTKKESKQKKKGGALKIVLIILVAILIIVSSVFGYYVYKSDGSIKSAVINIVKDVVGDQDPIFVLILGVSEDISVELTDTIMLAGYNPDTNQAFLLSIPRDTFVGKNEATAGGYDKINALYQTNPEKTVTAVENLTGVNIDHYITVKTSVLVDIVDAIGGVEFDVPINMDYDDPTQDLHIHLKAGKQVLNGEQAEQVVRFRHNNNGTTYSAEYGDNDEGRMRTQREFLKELAKQVIQTKNVDQIKQITTAIFDNLETNITLSKILGYAPYIIDFNINDLQMEQLPGTPAKLNELWFYKAYTSDTKDLINKYVQKLGLTEAEKKQYIKEPVVPKKSNSTTTKNENKNAVINKVTNKTTNTVNNTINKNVVINNNVIKNEVTNKNTINNTTNKNNTVTNNIVNSTTNENVVDKGNNIDTGNKIDKNEIDKNEVGKNEVDKNETDNKNNTTDKKEETNKDNNSNKDNDSNKDIIENNKNETVSSSTKEPEKTTTQAVE